MPTDDSSSYSEPEGNHWNTDEVDEGADDTEDSSFGPSPVVAVILICALGVVFSAIFAAFFIDLSNSTLENTNKPSVVVEEHPKNSSITVSVSEIPDKYEYVTVKGPGKKAIIRNERTLVFENAPDKAKIIVTGTYTEVHGTYSTQESTHTVLLYSSEITV